MWMRRGTQATVLTPGQNAKHFLAGAQSTRTGHLIWVTAPRKRSALVVALLEACCRHFCRARVIHLIVDNWGIHTSRATQAALRRLPRIRLHFLPTYSPKHNPIGRLWEDLHANVTRNHRFQTMAELVAAVEHFLRFVSPYTPGKPPLARAA